MPIEKNKKYTKIIYIFVFWVSTYRYSNLKLIINNKKTNDYGKQ